MAVKWRFIYIAYLFVVFTQTYAAENDLKSLRLQVEQQQKELEELNRQLAQTADKADYERILSKQLERLKNAVRQDLPYRLQQRQDRLTQLEGRLDNDAMAPAEKLRRILEAYQHEINQGLLLETWEGEIKTTTGDVQIVTFLRFGRMTMVYQSFDAGQTALWDSKAGAWISLDNRLADDVRKGIQIALKHSPPDLLVMPVTGGLE
jgi:predicted RNase H-like nuclease (RuvC/YqgF family)